MIVHFGTDWEVFAVRAFEFREVVKGEFVVGSGQNE